MTPLALSQVLLEPTYHLQHFLTSRASWKAEKISFPSSYVDDHIWNLALHKAESQQDWVASCFWTIMPNSLCSLLTSYWCFFLKMYENLASGIISMTQYIHYIHIQYIHLFCIKLYVYSISPKQSEDMVYLIFNLRLLLMNVTRWSVCIKSSTLQGSERIYLFIYFFI